MISLTNAPSRFEEFYGGTINKDSNAVAGYTTHYEFSDFGGNFEMSKSSTYKRPFKPIECLFQINFED